MPASLLTWASFTFDAVLREDVADVAQVATHQLEDGSVIADHVVQLPTAVSAEILISDMPADGSAYRAGRADEVYLSLLQALAQATVSDLVTGVRSFADMVLTQVARSRARPEGAARLVVRWDPVRTVSGQEIAVPLPHTSTVAAPKVEQGKVMPDAPAAATVEKGSSILADLLGL